MVIREEKNIKNPCFNTRFSLNIQIQLNLVTTNSGSNEDMVITNRFQSKIGHLVRKLSRLK
jgi:hypothetical protein